ncbi:MAG TPA: formylglycine-generating enzyme family protein [Polyangiaceae bacterium]
MRARSYARPSSVWEQAARDADFTLWLPERVPLFFRRIPAGRFRMGARGYWSNEEPVHEVTIADDFYLGTFPVTQEQYRAVARRSPALQSKPEPSDFKGPRRPVENVTWRDAVRFADWLTRERAGKLPKGFGRACLPTEVEWEHACRAGTETEYYAGDGEAALGAVAWYGENSGGETHPVDERDESHPFGLFGMHGNVWEWCHDVFDETAYRRRVDGAVDPGASGREREYELGLESMLGSGRPRVLRGGSWNDHPEYCRSAFRLGDDPDVRDRNDGFRVCLVRRAADEKRSRVPREPEAEGRGRRRKGPVQLARAGGEVRTPERRRLRCGRP